MKKLICMFAILATVSLSSCHDNDNPESNAPAPAGTSNSSIIVQGQSARSVLTLGFLLANHTELPVGSRATDYGYEYDDDDGVFLTEEEAAAFLAPYTRMGRELRDALIRSYFPATSRSGDGGGTAGGDGGGETPDGGGGIEIPGGGGGETPWDDNMLQVLDPEERAEVDMLYRMTDEEVTEVALILSTMGYDEQITEINGCEISMQHTIDCLIGVIIPDKNELAINIFADLFSKWSYSHSGKKVLIRIFKKQLIRFISRLTPGIGYISMAYDIYNFTNCMLNPELHKLPEDQYNQLREKYEWLSEYDTIELEIINE